MPLKKTLIPAFLMVLTVLSAGQALAGSLYPMENGGPRRENRSLSPSPLRLPVKTEWMNNSCLPLGDAFSNPIILSDRVAQSFAGGVRCYDRNSGQKLWTWMCDPSTNLWNAPCYDEDRDLIYVGCYNGDLVALNAQNGQVAWSKTHRSTPWPAQRSSPTYVNGKIYAGDGSFGFYCLDPDTRAVLWYFDFSVFFGFSYRDPLTTPAFDNGEVYVGTVRGDLWKLNADTGAVQWHVNLGVVHEDSVLISDEYVYILGKHAQVQCRSRANGSLVWTASSSALSGDTNGCLALCGDMLIVPGDSWKVWGLNRHTGALCWTTRLNGNFALNSPFVVCGKVFISACHGDFYALDGATGQIEWRLNHGVEYTFVGWAEADGQLYVADRNGSMMCFTSETPGDPADCRCDLTGQPPVGHIPSPAPTSIPRPVGICYAEGEPTATRTNTPTATNSPTPTQTGTLSPVVTQTFTWTHTPTGSPTPGTSPDETLSPVPTHTWTDTHTPTFTPTGTESPVETPTLDPTCGCHPSSPTPTPTLDPSCGCHPATPTPTLDPSCGCVPSSPTPTPTLDPVCGCIHPTLTPTPVPPTPTFTPVFTHTLSPTPTPTVQRVCDPRPYPNPCRGREVRCKVAGGPYDEVDLKIYSTDFRRLKGKKHPCTGVEEEEAVCELRDEDGMDLANGLYYLQVETRSGTTKCKYVRKVLIQR